MRLAVVLVGMLAGCAQTPDDLRDRGTRFEFSGKQPPELTAHCIGRNIERISGERHSNERRLPDGSWEVTERMGHYGAFSLALVEPAGSGSRVTVWVSRHLLVSHKEWADVRIAGC